MPTPILLTSHVIPILQAALDADYQQLAKLSQKHPTTSSSLNELSQQIRQYNEKLSSIAEAGITSLEQTYDILTTNMSLQNQATVISDAIASVATATEEMAASASEVSVAAEQTAARAQESYQKTESGNEAISSMMGNMDLLESAMGSMFEGVQKFSGFTEEINSLTSSVRDIANQTNLLALNAAIEAARAGEAGRGFAVVADEVKQLASKTEKATIEIETVTNTMNTLMEEVGGSVGSSQERLAHSLDSLETVAIALADVTSVVNDVTEQVQTISTSANEQRYVSQEMAGKLNEITLSVHNENQQIAKMAEHTSGLNNAIKRQFELLSSFNHDEVFLQAVKSDHVNWKIRLATMALGGAIIPENELTDHTQCRLGKWYYSTGKETYGSVEAFRNMEAPHARVHAIGKEIAQLALSGQTEAACQKIEEMAGYSRSLFAFIEELLENVRKT